MSYIVTQLKDLKKQVQSERSRADRLQEKLQQVLAESPHSQQSKCTQPFSICVHVEYYDAVAAWLSGSASVSINSAGPEWY